MNKAGYYIFFALNYIITLLPLKVLYLFSDIIFVMLYYFPSYRRDVVAGNLRNAFPEMSEDELRKTTRRFYRHIADLIVETLKVTHMSGRQMSRRFRYRDMTLLDRLYAEGRDVIAVCNHYNNWEWLSSMPMYSPYKALTIYKPMKNKYFDRFFLDLRTKYGVTASPMQSILREMVKARKENVRTITAFIADQTPVPGEYTYWTTFLNQETGFYAGTEKVAVMLDMAVVFINIAKVKRGYYEAELSLLTENASEEPPGSITEKHIRKLEQIIREKPEYWLWSHRRWKYKRTKQNDQDSSSNT